MGERRMPVMNTTINLELKRFSGARIVGLARQLARAGRLRAQLDGSTSKVAFTNSPLRMLQLATARGMIGGESTVRTTKANNIAAVGRRLAHPPEASLNRIAGNTVRKDESTPDSTVLDGEVSADIATRLRQRDPSVIDQLYDALGGRAFGLAYRILGDGPAAEDAVQESFLWIWNNGERIDSRKGRVASLLLTIVHRRSIDALRAR
jgi:hypothetical protein